MQVRFGVLGPVAAWDGAGDAIALKGPRHRAVLARLIVARRRVVPVAHLVTDLWEDPPPDAVGALRTFVAALRRALEPQRPPRSPARLLVTEGPGYALRAEPDAVDAWRFERAVTTAGTPADVLPRVEEALGWWRGPAYADFSDEPWARTERSRLTELRLHAVERQAEARLDLGLAGEAVPDLDTHVAEHPWREEGWRLLALALYRTGRQGDALAVLRRARDLLVEHLGVDPGPGLSRLEADILHHAPHLAPGGQGPADTVWARAAAAYDRSVPTGARARLESTVGLMRDLAVTGGGGLRAAREHRVAAIAAAEELGDVELTARVIGAYDVPAIWTRLDDPDQATHVIAAAERTLAALPSCALPPGKAATRAVTPPVPEHAAAASHGAAVTPANGVRSPLGARDAVRARLLATIALESRGTNSPRGPATAREAELLARRLDDPGLLAFALNGVFMQTFHRTGLAPHRDAIGTELIALSARHGLATYEVLGHLIRLQARSALADFAGADAHAAAADQLAARHELPLVSVFTQWYRALRLDATGQAPPQEVEAAYRSAASRLDGAGMPGLEHGLLPLVLLCLRLRHPSPASADDSADFGPYEPWTRPLLLLRLGHRREAAAKLRDVPDPPRDLLLEAMWCLVARAAAAVGDRETMARARTALTPAAAELAGAGSGLLTLGPVSQHLDLLR
ncbi:BTAD domain-containing putative transcriptional regulator [Nonomuraea jabiensis]|uniref:DNA-binding SARP family transcriptional activator n=1 Tax=Nonomuraea jabiensis TaxID=882448 RepID=A0A7W9GC78_9ACTN|nr:BTAD domain-containing putative transcriptional regulator [Nonomuraea jabiensis]MBB5781089.1 DNA-binding SARP family transcriptional activator [Nonomuraea jabiensis]